MFDVRFEEYFTHYMFGNYSENQLWYFISEASNVLGDELASEEELDFARRVYNHAHSKTPQERKRHSKRRKAERRLLEYFMDHPEAHHRDIKEVALELRIGTVVAAEILNMWDSGESYLW